MITQRRGPTDLSPDSALIAPEELIMNEVDRTIDQANKIKRVGTIGCIVLAVFLFMAIFVALVGFSGAAQPTDDQREAAATPTTSELSGSPAAEDNLDPAPRPEPERQVR
jgi:hypothetical protein